MDARRNRNRFARFSAAQKRSRDRHARIRHRKKEFLFGTFLIFHVISVHFFCVHEQVRDLHGNGHLALLDGAKHHVLALSAAALRG